VQAQQRKEWYQQVVVDSESQVFGEQSERQWFNDSVLCDA